MNLEWINAVVPEAAQRTPCMAARDARLRKRGDFCMQYTFGTTR